MVPVPAPTLPSATAPVSAAASAARTWASVMGRDRMALRKPSLVSPTTGLIDRTPAIPGCSSIHADQGIGGLPDAECTGEENGRLELTQLVHLGRAEQLPEAVADVDRSGHPIEEEISAVGQDGGDAGADRIADRDRGMPDPNARNIGDRVARAGLVDAGCHAEGAGADSRLGSERRGRQQQADDEGASHRGSS